MKKPKFSKKPAIRGKRIAGFLLGHSIRYKTLWNIITCIFFVLSVVPITDATAIEVSGSAYSVQLIEFMQGGGFTSSANLSAQYTAIGGSLISLQLSTSSNFNLLTGFIHLLSLVESVFPEGALIADLTCRTDVLGDLIAPATWQRDNDPYFYWIIIAEPESLVSGFSVSLDVEPDETMDIAAPHYEYPQPGIASGKHIFYVLPYTSGGEGWSRDNQLSFEIWVDEDVPSVSRTRPMPNEITADGLALISCQLDDAHSGIDIAATTLTLNGSNAAFNYDTGSKLLTYKPDTPLTEGKNTVFVKAYDVAGNYVVKGWDFLVDTMPPSGSIKINNAEAFTHSAYVFLNIEAQDAISGVKSIYLSNDGVFDTEMTEPRPYNTVIPNWLLSDPNTDGVKNVYVKFADGAGNVSQTYQASIHLKRLTPDTNIISGPEASTGQTSAAFRYEASKPGCQFSYKIDNQDWSGWLSVKEASFAGLALGNHYFYVKGAYDLNGDGTISLDEEDATPASWVWTVMSEEEMEELKEKILFWRR